MPKIAASVRAFGPEMWGEILKFKNLYPGTHRFKPFEARAVSGCYNHFMKAVSFRRLADRIRPDLVLDLQKLEDTGASNMEHSREFTIVAESVVIELHSAIECAVKVVRAIYGPQCRGFKDSTSGFFTNFNKIEGPIPAEITALVRDATWYPALLKLRSELVHGDMGRCRLDEPEGTVRYGHDSAGSARDRADFEDFEKWIDTKFAQVNEFLGGIFHWLNRDLTGEVDILCGFAQGSPLMRRLKPEPEIDFNSGVCLAFKWFELPDRTPCPWLSQCGAYERAKAASA